MLRTVYPLGILLLKWRSVRVVWHPSDTRNCGIRQRKRPASFVLARVFHVWLHEGSAQTSPVYVAALDYKQAQDAASVFLKLKTFGLWGRAQLTSPISRCSRSSHYHMPGTIGALRSWHCTKSVWVCFGVECSLRNKHMRSLCGRRWASGSNDW